MNIFFILLMNAFFAATFPLGKFALQYTGPLFLTAARMLIAGMILLLYSFYKNKNAQRRSPVIPLRDWYLFVKTSLFYIVLSFVPEFWALKYLSSIKTNLLWSVQPFFAALLGFILFSEHLSYKKIAALCIGFSGMLPIIFTCDIGEVGLVDICSVSYPELSLFIAVFSTTYAWFLIKQLLSRNYSLSFINGVTMTIGGLACLAISVAEHIVYQQELYHNFGAVIAYSLALVIVSNILGYGLYGYFLSRYSITFLAFSGFTCPLFGFLFSYLLGEPIHMAYVYGCILIISGLYLFYQEE